MDPPQEHGERVGALRNRNKMNVIRHKAPGQHTDSRIRQVAAHRTQLGGAVGRSEEHPLPIGPALGDMVGLSGKYTALVAWHLARIALAKPENSRRWQTALTVWTISPWAQVRPTQSLILTLRMGCTKVGRMP